MSQHKAALDEVTTLIEERRQFEQWLAGLDARTEAAPAHVLERVRGDYQSRLARVVERLASHQSAIDAELNGLRSRLSLTDAELQLRRDERAEVELRAAVGELAEGEVKKSLSSVDQTLDALVVERSEIEAGITRLSEVREASTAPLARSSTSVAAVVEPAATDAPAPETALPPEDVAAPPEVSTAESSPPAPAVNPPPPAAEPAAPPVPVPATSRTSSTSPGPGRKSTPFDEMGFLSAVVGDGAPPAQTLPPTVGGPRLSGVTRQDQDPSPLIGPGRSSTEIRRSGEPPFADNVPANTPIKLRASGPLEPQKTLKCAECAALNYPTEWYCEKCGAELATL